ncbi:MAG: PVC-type heme-binding CxxCH protein, partial [Limisphaerales bacterium]
MKIKLLLIAVFSGVVFLNNPPVFAAPENEIKFAGLSPEAAAKAMTLPPGFSAKLFAGEPDVKQPVAFCIDDRGRLWVAENYSYPNRQPEGQGHDRILIFEDTNGDGKFDKRSVFADNLNLVSAIEIGFGGVWIGASPYLIFIPCQDGDDKPSGPPQILLDGFGYQDTHDVFSTFIWGPDGWLYGGSGITCYSKVGQPGAPDSERVILNGAIWRFHPLTKKFERFAEGVNNPWGLDFDDRGQLIITGCVIPHLWHIVQGGRYQRLMGNHVNPHVYDDIQTIADHRHWAGEDSHAGREGYRDEKGELKVFADDFNAGGGHAHAGAMIYLGDNWPEKYRHQIFMNNLHGHRLNVDILEPKGSGFVGNHGPDFLFTNDKWSLILNLQYGPDGSVYM